MRDPNDESADGYLGAPDDAYAKALQRARTETEAEGLRRINRQARERNKIADELRKMAARQSIRTVFGWVHPDCVTLLEAERLLRGEPEKQPDEHPIGVLS